MAWIFRYELKVAPEPRNDGSRDVIHSIGAQGSENAGVDWVGVPGRTNKQIPVPADDIETVLAMPNGGAKIAAYKQLLIDNLNRTSEPVVGWTVALMTLVMENNARSLAQAEAANIWITVDLGQSYPVPFTV